MLFTIIIPVYKAEKYLDKCINSILAQSFQDYEVILVDDGSPDNSAKICDNYANTHKRIRVIHKTNAGVVSARNAGLLTATGQYILFVDADDWIAENTLQDLSDVIMKYDAPDMILFDSYRVYQDRNEQMSQSLSPGFYDKERLNKDVIPHMIYDRKQPFLNSMIIGQLWNKAYKRHIIVEHHCKDETIYKYEDFACVYECLYFADTLFYLNKSLYFYNKMNEGSAMATYDSTYFVNHSKVIRYAMEHLGKYSETLKLQIDAYNVSGICIGVFHEMRHGNRLLEARGHIKKALEETTCLKEATCDNLPIHAKVYIFMLKHKMYMLTLLLTKIYLKIK